MSFGLALSVIAFASFIVIIVIYEYKSRAEKDVIDEVEKTVQPAAKVANELHKRKFGRASTELQETFPELKAFK